LLAALIGQRQVFDEPETWLTCACAVLLQFEQMRRADDGLRPSTAINLL